MLRRVFHCVALLLCISGYAHGKQEAIRFDIRDFYFYDESNLTQRVTLAPKVMVNFLKQLPEEDQIAFLNKFPHARQKKDTTQSFRYILEFPVPISEQNLMDILTEVNSSEIAEGIPIVLIDNVEAISIGFVVQSRTPVAPGMLGKHLQKIGEFSIRQAVPEGHGWLFVIDEIKPPLHMYPLINLIHNDPWVKSARPKFQFLHPAIVGRVEVNPVSGTVDEMRTVTLFVRVFDPHINMRTDFLPNFGEGKFKPNPAPLPLFFFPAVGTREPIQEFTDDRGRVFSLQWRFRLFTPGEWTIPPQTIPYERFGEQFTITSVSAPFVVTSLIGSLAINDMPSPKLLVLPDTTSDAVVKETPPLFPPRWFDRWISHISPIAKVSYSAAVVLGAIGFGFAVFWGFVFVDNIFKKKLDSERLIHMWQKTCREACNNVSLESYRRLEIVLWDMLFAVFAGKLVPRPALRDVEESVRDAFDDAQWNRLCVLYEELGSSYARNFAPDAAKLHDTSENLLSLIRHLTRNIDVKER